MFLPEKTLIASGPVIIENGKVLLNREIKEARDNKESEFFMFPGGTAEDFNLTLEEVCRREVMEEMGIDIEIIKPLRTLMIERPEKNGIVILVHYLAKRIGEINPGPETVEWGWYDINNLPENCAPNVYEIIADIKKEL